MTCKERYLKENPHINPSSFAAGDVEIGCPDDYGYLEEPDYCGEEHRHSCEKCWDREIPGTEEKEKEFTLRRNPTADTCADGLYPHEKTEPRILDSGDRTLFETGAVRDCQAGKGRCDLLPMDIVGDYLDNPIIRHIAQFCETGDETWLYQALWEFAPHWTMGDDIHERCNANMMLEVAKHFEEGGKKYGDDNWRKGIPTKRYIDSAVRHYLKYLRGDKDEPHDRAFCWNVLCCAWTCVHKPELNDYTKEKEE